MHPTNDVDWSNVLIVEMAFASAYNRTLNPVTLFLEDEKTQNGG